MSENRAWLFRIEDIVHSIDRIKTAIVDRRLQIIGDAAQKIPDDVKVRYPELPWPKMIGLRNFVVHEYNNVDRKIVWDTIINILPSLKVALEKLLDSEKKQQ